MNKIICLWHDHLDMPKYDIGWHRQDIEDETIELIEARGLINRWSELADVAYTYTRAHWSGHSSLLLPISKHRYLLGLIYMFPKYQLRWNFFNCLGKKFDKTIQIKEVRNPRKVYKLDTIAEKYGIDKTQFSGEARKKLGRSILFK